MIFFKYFNTIFRIFLAVYHKKLSLMIFNVLSEHYIFLKYSFHTIITSHAYIHSTAIKKKKKNFLNFDIFFLKQLLFFRHTFLFSVF
jgi:hypothetical protein